MWMFKGWDEVVQVPRREEEKETEIVKSGNGTEKESDDGEDQGIDRGIDDVTRTTGIIGEDGRFLGRGRGPLNGMIAGKRRRPRWSDRLSLRPTSRGRVPMSKR